MDYARCVLEGVSRDDVGNGSRDDDHFPGQFVSVGKEHYYPTFYTPLYNQFFLCQILTHNHSISYADVQATGSVRRTGCGSEMRNDTYTGPVRLRSAVD